MAELEAAAAVWSDSGRSAAGSGAYIGFHDGSIPSIRADVVALEADDEDDAAPPAAAPLVASVCARLLGRPAASDVLARLGVRWAPDMAM